MLFRSGPQPIAMSPQFAAHAGQAVVTAAHTAQQQRLDLLTGRSQEAFESRTGEFSGAKAMPLTKQFFRASHQVVSQAADLSVGMVDQRLDVSFEMRPAPSTEAAER